MEAFMIQRYVNVDDVSILKWSLIWNAVADDLVDGRTD